MKNNPNKFYIISRLIPSFLLVMPALIEANVIIALAGFEPFLLLTTTDFLLLILLIVISFFIRHKGDYYQLKLEEEWGGLPTTRFLRIRNTEIDKTLKNHYRCNIGLLFPDIVMPCEKDELANKETTDMQYIIFISRLREMTRDKEKFELINHENMMFCFIRNMKSIKWYAIILSSICIVISIIFHIFLGWIVDLVTMVSLITINCLYILAWFLFVKKIYVKAAAEKYAVALLNSTDYLLSDNKAFHQ